MTTGRNGIIRAPGETTMHAIPAGARHTTAVPVRYDYLDALRGWAFLGVLAIHTVVLTGGNFAGAAIANAGKYGVQLFFMVSAFTIFLTLDRSWRSGRPAWDEFFIRRFFRILPMFWVGLALYSFAPGRGKLYAGLTFGPLDYALTATLQHGWHPALINSLVPGGWSIAVEGTFYLLAPLCYRAVRRWQVALWLFLGALVLSAGARWAGASLFAGVSGELREDFFSWWFPAQLPVFACGILVYQVVKGTDGRPGSKTVGAVLLATSAVALCAAIGVGQRGWIGGNVSFALAFVPLILGLKSWPVSLLVNPVTRLLGSVSYSAYLLHFLVLRLTQRFLDECLYSWDDGLRSFLLVFGVALAGTTALSWLTWRYVERPCIGLGARLIQRRRTVRANETATGPGLEPRPAAPKRSAHERTRTSTGYPIRS